MGIDVTHEKMLVFEQSIHIFYASDNETEQCLINIGFDYGCSSSKWLM